MSGAPLEASDWIDAIVVAAPAEWEEPTILLAEELGCGKVSAVVTGGSTRAESVRVALAEVPDEAVAVLVHDAARPLVADAVIERVLAGLGDGFDGVVPALAIPDTVKRLQVVAQNLFEHVPNQRLQPLRHQRRLADARSPSASGGGSTGKRAW